MKKLLALLLILVLPGTSVQADVVVLIHGFLGSPASWQHSGINPRLSQSGWQDAGVIFHTPGGNMLTGNSRYNPENRKKQENPVYSLVLPSRAPILLQADLLHSMLMDLEKRHSGEKMVLVGHSAGGLAARASLVRHGAGPVEKLITIASPHLGTGLASYALSETRSFAPIAFLKDIFGGIEYDIARSSVGLLLDLVPAAPGTFLHWLNHQPHPDIAYVSVIRGHDQRTSGDRVVAGFSQDMNNIPALHGKSQRHYLPSGHSLNPLDGDFLAVLLEQHRVP